MLLLAAACRPGQEACVVVASVGSTPHAVEVEVARRLLGAGAARGVCLGDFRHTTYEAVGAPDAEVALALRVAAMDDVMVVVGHATSRGSLAAAPVYRDSAVTQIVPVGTSRELHRWAPWTLSFVPDDSAEGEQMAEYAAQKLGARRALAIYSADEYGEGLLDGLRTGVARAGIRVLGAVRAVEGSDLATLIQAALRHRNVDVVFVLGDYRMVGDAARVLHRSRPTLTLVAGDAAFYPEGLVRRAGSALGTLRLISFRLPDPARPGATAYLAAFRAVAGRDPTPNEALTHDALMVAVAAVDSAGPDRVRVRDWLAALGGSHAPWPGVTGDISFAVPDTARFAVFRIERGMAVPVTPR